MFYTSKLKFKIMFQLPQLLDKRNIMNLIQKKKLFLININLYIRYLIQILCEY